MMSRLDVYELAGTERVTVASGRGFFPVLVKTGDGALLVVYRDGAGHGGLGGFLAAKRSEDGGRTWSEQVTVVRSREYDDRNPAVGVARDGTVTVAYLANGRYGPGGKSLAGERRDPPKRHAALVHSTDGGRTWGEPMLWTDATPWNHLSPYGQMLTLDDGGMGMCVYWDASYLLWSLDDGWSWGDLTLVADDVNETAYCVLPGGSPTGSWLALGRKREEPTHVMMLLRRSSDGGHTWSGPVEFFPGWRFPGNLTVLSDGSVLACYGFREPPHGVRARRSPDGGRTWSERELVLDDFSWTGDCGYPSTVLVEGWLVTAYYSAGNFRNFSDPSDSTCEVVRYREHEIMAALV